MPRQAIIQQEHLNTLSVPAFSASNSLLNQLIIEQLHLSPCIDFTFTLGEFITVTIAGWKHLPRVAMLVGCYLLRAPLLFSGSAAVPDDLCRAFMALPLGKDHLPAQPLYPLKTDDLQAHGAQALIATLAHFSPALAHRATLLFPPRYLPETKNMPMPVKNIAPIIIMAFDYAKMY